MVPLLRNELNLAKFPQCIADGNNNNNNNIIMIIMFTIVISIIVTIRHPEADPRARHLGLSDPRSHQRENPPALPPSDFIMMVGEKMVGDGACCREENEMEDETDLLNS